MAAEGVVPPSYIPEHNSTRDAPACWAFKHDSKEKVHISTSILFFIPPCQFIISFYEYNKIIAKLQIKSKDKMHVVS